MGHQTFSRMVDRDASDREVSRHLGHLPTTSCRRATERQSRLVVNRSTRETPARRSPRWSGSVSHGDPMPAKPVPGLFDRAQADVSQDPDRRGKVQGHPQTVRPVS